MIILALSSYMVILDKSQSMRKKKIIHMYIYNGKIYVDVQVGENEFFYHVPYENYRLI